MALLRQHKRRALSKKRKIFRASKRLRPNLLRSLIIRDRHPAQRGKLEQLRVAQKGNC